MLPARQVGHIAEGFSWRSSRRPDQHLFLPSSGVVFVAAGQYTIGVFRISLVEPEEVEPTVFQVQGNLTRTE